MVGVTVALTAEALIKRRLHLPVIKLAFTVAVVALAIVELIYSEFNLGTREATTAMALWANELAPALMILPVIVWFAPRSALAWACCLMWVVSLGSVEFPLAWQILGSVVLLALAWLLIRPLWGRDGGRWRLPGGHRPAEDAYAIGDGRLARIALWVAAGVLMVLLGWAVWAWEGPPERPSFSVFWVGFLVPAMVIPATIELVRIRRRLRLLRLGGEASLVRVTRDDEGHHVVPVDAATFFLRFTRLEEVIDRRLSVAFDDWITAHKYCTF